MLYLFLFLSNYLNGYKNSTKIRLISLCIVDHTSLTSERHFRSPPTLLNYFLKVYLLLVISPSSFRSSKWLFCKLPFPFLVTCSVHFFPLDLNFLITQSVWFLKFVTIWSTLYNALHVIEWLSQSRSAMVTILPFFPWLSDCHGYDRT